MTTTVGCGSHCINQKDLWRLRALASGVEASSSMALANLDFSNSICLWRRMKPATAVFSGNKGKFNRVAALWFEVRGLRGWSIGF
jgi:hypothetical protein